MLGNRVGTGSHPPRQAVKFERADPFWCPFDSDLFEFGAQERDAQVIVTFRIDEHRRTTTQAPDVRDGQRFASVIVVDARSKLGIGALNETEYGSMGGPAEITGCPSCSGRP